MSDIDEGIELAAGIEAAYQQRLTTKRRVSQSASNRASNIGHPCVRYLVLSRTRGNEFRLPDPGLQSVFDMGNHVERATVAELGEIGFEWIWAQRPFVDAKHQLSGHIDGAVSTKEGRIVPAEIKSMQGSHFDRIRSGIAGLHDLLNAKQFWIRKYPVQVAMYLHLTQEPLGVIILRDKWFWRLKAIPIPLSEVHDLVAEALITCDMVNGYIANDVVPARIEYDRDICGRCDARDICLPGMTGEGAALLEDEELREKLSELSSLAGYAKRHETLKEEVSDELKLRLASLGVKEAVVANAYVASLSTQPRKRMKATGEEYTITTLRLSELEAPLVGLTKK